MKNCIVTFIALSVLSSLCLGASPVTTDSSSTSTATSTNNAQQITFASPGSTYATVKSTVGTSMGGFSGSFSSDYCGATSQASSGWLGMGISIGMHSIDSSCLMLRTFERTQQAATAVSHIDPQQSLKLREASLEILALIDPKIKEIFERKMLIGSKENALSYPRSSNDTSQLNVVVENLNINKAIAVGAINATNGILPVDAEKKPNQGSLEKASTTIR